MSDTRRLASVSEDTEVVGIVLVSDIVVVVFFFFEVVVSIELDCSVTSCALLTVVGDVVTIRPWTLAKLCH